MKGKLIINADDFGLDPNCDEAIIDLARNRCITSTTILSNFCKEESIQAIRFCPISTGIHINLIEGKPLCSPGDVSTLVDSHGMFKPAFHLWRDFLLGRINILDIEKEITEQFKHLSNHGLQISHADSHQHIHQYPYLGNCILKILEKLKCNKVRNCKLSEFADLRMVIVRAFHHFVKSDMDKFTSPDILIPTFSINRRADIGTFIKSIPLSIFKKYPVSEFMTHPATANTKNSYLNKKAEYTFWKNESWKDYLDKNKIELITYNDL